MALLSVALVRKGQLEIATDFWLLSPAESYFLVGALGLGLL